MSVIFHTVFETCCCVCSVQVVFSVKLFSHPHEDIWKEQLKIFSRSPLAVTQLPDGSLVFIQFAET